MKSVNWLTVLFSGIGTALFIFLGNLGYDMVTTNNPRLVYGVTPPASFVSDTTRVQIHSGFIENVGGKNAEKVLAVLTIPSPCVLTAEKFVPSSKTIKYEINRSQTGTIELGVPDGLNKTDRIDFSLLLECDTDENVEIDVRGTGVQGEEQSSISPQSTIFSSTFGSSLFVLLVMLMLMMFLMLNLVRGRSQVSHPQQAQKNSHQKLARAYKDIGDDNAAVAELKKLLELDPGDDNSHASLSMAYGRVNQLDNALLESKIAVSINEKDWYNHYCMGSVYARMEKFSDSFQALEKAYNAAKSREKKTLKKYVQHAQEEYDQFPDQFSEFRKDDNFVKFKNLFA